MIDFSDFSAEIFQILRAYGRDMVLYDENGNRVYEPTEARRMYVTGDNVLVSISEDGDHSALRLYLSPSMNLAQVKGFIETLRNMASKANLLFHVKKFDKEITPQQFASQASVNEQENLNMNLLEGMYGTSKSSYLKLENARMIVRHSERVKENMIGARGRAIAQIFVENAMGERFLFPVNMLSGARAMTQHVNQGGTFADDVGQQIIRMAQNFRDLARVAQHTNEHKAALPETAGQLRESVLAAMKGMKLQFNRIYEAKSYVRESQRLVAGSQLNEDGEQVAEKIEALKSILGEAFEDTVLTTVARLVALPEAQEPMIEEEVAEVVAEEDVMDAPEDDLADDQAVEEAEEVVAEDELPAPNNGVVKQFEAWMDEFDPEAALAEAPTEDDQDLPFLMRAYDTGYGDEMGGDFEERCATLEDAIHAADNISANRVEVIDTRTGEVVYRDAEPGYEDGSDDDEELNEYRVKKPDPEEMSVHDIKSAIMTLKAQREKVSAFDPQYRDLGAKIADLERDLKKAMPYGKATTEGAVVEAPDNKREQFFSKQSWLAAAQAANLEINSLQYGEIDLNDPNTGENVGYWSGPYGYHNGGSESGWILARYLPAMESEEQLDEYRVKKPDPEEMSMHDIKSAIASFETKLRSMSPFDPEYRTTRSKIEDLKRDLAKVMPYGKATSESAEQPVDEGFDAELDQLMKRAGIKK